MNIIFTLLLFTSLAYSQADMTMGQRLQNELSYLDNIAKNPTVYSMKTKKIVKSKRNSEEYLKLEDVFDGKDELTSALAAPKRDKASDPKPFKPIQRSRD